jgi:hypothetical protein
MGMNGDAGYREDLDSDTKGVYRVMSGWASADSSTDRQPRISKRPAVECPSRPAGALHEAMEASYIVMSSSVHLAMPNRANPEDASSAKPC